MRKKYNKGDILDLDGSGDTTMKDVLIGRGVIDADGNMISKLVDGVSAIYSMDNSLVQVLLE